MFDFYPTFVKPNNQDDNDPIPDGERRRISNLHKSNKVVYNDDNLIVIHPYETTVEKVEHKKNRILIDDISILSSEHIDVNDPTLYLFVFIKDKYYYGDIYKGYFSNTSLLLSPIFAYKVRDYIETNIIPQFKKITSWFGSYILEQHNYTFDVLNRMNFHIIAYNVGVLTQNFLAKNLEKLYYRHISTKSLFQKQFTRLLLLLNSIAPENYKLNEYVFPIKFIAPNNEIISTCKILNELIIHAPDFLPSKPFKFEPMPNRCF